MAMYDDCPKPSVGTIVQDICGYSGVTNVDTTAIDEITCRGYVCANVFSSADAIRVLQRTYFFDFTEIDGVLVAVTRGAASVATIPREDMVVGEEGDFESAREQGIEFPQKLHVSYANAESDYTPTKQTSERRSKDIKSYSEMTIEVPINLVDDDAFTVAQTMHKDAWVEMEGRIRIAVSEEYHRLVASDPIEAEVYDSVYKRVRILKITFVDGVLQIEAVVDRTAPLTNPYPYPPGGPPPIEPPGNLVDDTNYVIADLPILFQNQDTLHVYVAANAENDGVWTGAIIEMLVDTEWLSLGTTVYPATMGTLAAALPSISTELDETNTITVTLNDDDVASISQAEFDVGGNLALVGDELIQFRDVTPNGTDYDLSYLMRRRLHTYAATHAIGTRFVKLFNPTVIELPSALVNETITFRCYSIGNAPAVADEFELDFYGLSQFEWEPEDPIMYNSGTDWVFEWSNNKRVGALNIGVTSSHLIATHILLQEESPGFKSFWIELAGTGETTTFTAAQQTAAFGGVQTGWEFVTIYSKNRYTGLGHPAFATLIDDDVLLNPDTEGFLLLSGEDGALLLE